MTAEVLVMNKNGVAIAADSVVVITTHDGPKAYNTISKLFPLSTTEPVAVMIYGSVEFALLPWETLIKDHKVRLGTKKFATLDDYANEFLEYLRRVDLSDEDQASMFFSMLYSQFSHLTNGLRAILQQQTEECLETSESSLDIVERFLDSAEQDLETLADLPEFAHMTLADVVRRYRREVFRARQLVLNEPSPIPMNRDCMKRFWRLAHLYLVKSAFSSTASGIVVAGLGDSEFLPSVRSYLIDGVYMNVMKCQVTNQRSITKKNQAIILPFAQTEMVYRFMQGVDRDYQSYQTGLFSEFLTNIVSYVIEQYVPGEQESAARSDLENILTEKLTVLESLASDYRQTHFNNPVIDAVKNLPKHDLATLAEALVQLTSLRRKMSTDSQTVGEPIDVVLVAKSDGFIWVKKKTHFDLQLNLQRRSMFRDPITQMEP